MDYGLKSMYAENLRKANDENIKKYSEYVFKTIVSAIVSNNITTIENSIEELADNLERLEEYGKDTFDKEKIYYYGRLSSITDLALNIINLEKESEKLENISKAYPLLLPALDIINKKDTISGMELQKSLNMKSSSNLSNFYNRVKKYELITVRKFGNTNYYSLTLKGERMLEDNKCSNINKKDNYISEKTLYSVLDKIADEISKEDPNYINVLLASSITQKENKEILKHKVQNIISKRDKYISDKFKKIYIKLEEDDSIKTLQSKDISGYSKNIVIEVKKNKSYTPGLKQYKNLYANIV